MAHKRMFSKDITTSDAFREMPTSSQALYFHLGMEADDDGFLDNYRGLMRAINASDDDLKILLGKRFLILFPTLIIVVKHWLLNNTIRKDRYTETKHLDEKRALLIKENGAYTELPVGTPSGNQMATQYRIEEDRIVSAFEDEPRVIVSLKEDGEERAPKKEKVDTKDYSEMCSWLERVTGVKIVNRVKQYAHLAKAKGAGISRDRLKKRANELLGESWYQTHGLDWGGVVSSFDKRA